MKKILVLCTLIGFMLQSCVMKEEIHVSQKGEVNYLFNINFSELLKMAPDGKPKMGEDVEKALDFFNGEELSIEQYLDIILAKEKNAAFKKDSIKAEHVELFKNLENVRMQFTLNDSIGDLNFKVNAKNVSELNSALAGLEQISNLAGKGDANVKQNMSINSIISDKTYFEYSQNVFERKVKETPKDLEEKTELSGMEGMFTYKMKVSFEESIKSVSYEDAVISKDEKSFTKQFKISDIITNPKVLEYKVELNK